MEADNIWTLILSVLMGGGGLAALIKARNESPLIGAQAQDIVIGNLMSENTRLEKQVERLRKENRELRARMRSLEQRLDQAGL